MDPTIRLRLCRLSERELPTPEAVATIAGHDPELLQDIAENYSSCPSDQDNVLIREAAQKALAALDQ